MNKVQQIVSDISGYTPTETGARNDAYYECSTDRAKWGFLVEFVYFGADDDKDISINDIIQIDKWLRRTYKNENERFQAFMALGVKNEE